MGVAAAPLMRAEGGLVVSQVPLIGNTDIEMLGSVAANAAFRYSFGCTRSRIAKCHK